MIKYKGSGKEVLELLKEHGYNTGVLRREKILPENIIQQIRQDKVVGMKTLDKICNLLKCQPSKIIEWIPDEKTE